jgi:hypothetical protein
MKLQAIFFCLLQVNFFVVSVRGEQTPDGTTADRVDLVGRVTDASTGEPIAKVKVILIGSKRSAATDREGRFQLRGAPLGEIELYITTVGYGLIKKRFTVRESSNDEIRIALHAEASQRLDEVTVEAGQFDQSETNLASEHSLNKQELQSLSMVIVADPVRALQALPGVAGNDDFKSEFALRGAGFRRIGFYVDGLLLPENPAHTVYGHENTGQISILNADTMSSATLLPGAFPSKYGDATAGLLNLETRDGNRVKPAGRVMAGLLSTATVFDGPIQNKRGAWLVAARKSYVSYLVNALSDNADDFNGIGVDFSDAQAKAVVDLTPRHQIGVNAIFGLTDFNPDKTEYHFDAYKIARSRSQNALLYGTWNFTAGPKFNARTKFFHLVNDYFNANLNRVPLQDGRTTHTGVRSDLSIVAPPSHRIESGIYLRRLAGSGLESEMYYVFPQYDKPLFRTVVDYKRRSDQQGYYMQDTWTARRLPMALTAGARVDRLGLTAQTVVTPRASLSIAPRENTRIRFGWGQYSDFPEFFHLFGSRGAPNLRAERSTHYNLSIEHLLGANTRILLEAYDREDKDLLFTIKDYLQRDGGDVYLNFPFQNSLRGHARGVEVSLHRRSANRLSGWLSYAYMKTRMFDRISGLTFVSDYDQAHTLSAYGGYRLTSTLNLSGQWRYGSGMPRIGSSTEDGRFEVYPNRNTQRLPAYSRVDLRVNKAYDFKRAKLTLSGEIINLFGRENYRQNGYRRNKMLPFLPSVGASIEF